MMSNFIVLVTMLLGWSSLAGAVTIVAPGTAASTEGDTYNVYPFNFVHGYYQQLYDASLFGG